MSKLLANTLIVLCDKLASTKAEVSGKEWEITNHKQTNTAQDKTIVELRNKADNQWRKIQELEQKVRERDATANVLQDDLTLSRDLLLRVLADVQHSKKVSRHTLRRLKLLLK